MSPELILILLMASPAVLLLALRINAALVFLSLCLGSVLVNYTMKDAISIVSGASTSMHASDTIVRLGLLLAPAILTMLFMMGTVKGKKRIFNVLPAAGVASLTALLVVPQLPPGVAHNIIHTSLWVNIQELQSGIVAISTLICLLFLWMQRPKHHGDDEKKGKKHKG
jgi:hypothetical protein